MKNDCQGCENIKQERFPFIRDGGMFIDTEDCGVKDSHMQIFYCPVCGRKLEEKQSNG